ncbi:MAG TPA: AraD1 family protein [Bryobacteraceae bacterium]|nr:AraD1 family protein [Bryobacteraceae bacterium]
MHLVQLKHLKEGRRAAIVDGARLHLLKTHRTLYDLAQAALEAGKKFAETAEEDRSSSTLDYDSIYQDRSEWQLLQAFDHPTEPTRCLVSGTGLTHKASAQNRANMHQQQATITDSMRMYEWGVEGGSPAAGEIGAQPEWFYKGNGLILRGHGDPLLIPAFAEDGGEEPEIAGVYIVDGEGRPRRVGLTIANEFSDHKMEKRNYLYLAPSKLRTCSIGPELVTDAAFDLVEGEVGIERGGRTLWSRPIRSGESHMCHTTANLEHHHFKYPEHRRPGDAHVHFFGADAFSFGEGIALEDGDVMSVSFAGFGRALKNTIRIDRFAQECVRALPL